jgi:hypothetical protein
MVTLLSYIITGGGHQIDNNYAFCGLLFPRDMEKKRAEEAMGLE